MVIRIMNPATFRSLGRSYLLSTRRLLCSGLCSALLLGDATVALSQADQPVQQKSPLRTLSDDFTLVYDVTSSETDAGQQRRDEQDALRQYEAMYKSGQMSKQTYESFVSSLRKSYAPRLAPQHSTVTISHSTALRALLVQSRSGDTEKTGIFSAKDQRTFSSSNKADLNYVFKGLRIDWMPGFAPLAATVGEISCIKEVTAGPDARTFSGHTLNPVVASRQPVFEPGRIRVENGEISEIESFVPGMQAYVGREWAFSDYSDVGGMRVPARISLTMNGVRAENFNKPVYQMTMVLVKASPDALDPEAFQYDTYLTGGKKGIQLDDGARLISFPYQAGIPLDHQAQAEMMRRRAAGRGTNATTTYTGVAALVALMFAGVFFVRHRRMQA